jgi:hypothetical protein
MKQQRLPLLLSAAALATALLGTTPIGEAAGRVAVKIPPLAQRANYAKVAGTANNAKALAGHKASDFALAGAARAGAAGAAGPAGAKGDPGPKGDKGAKGDPGSKGDRGPAGLVAAYTAAAGTSGTFTALGSGDNLVSLDLPAGKYLVLAEATFAPDGASASYFAGCRLTAGSASRAAVAAGARSTGTATFGPLTATLLYESASPQQAILNCNDTPTSPSRWADAHITAIQVTSSLVASLPTGGVTTTGR